MKKRLQSVILQYRFYKKINIVRKKENYFFDLNESVYLCGV